MDNTPKYNNLNSINQAPSAKLPSDEHIAKGWKIATIALGITTACLAGLSVLLAVTHDSQTPAENTPPDANDDQQPNPDSDHSTNVANQPYFLISEWAPSERRYYLALDNNDYTDGQNFLERDTYLLDTNSLGNTQAFQKIDLATPLKPLFDDYIASRPSNLTASCTEYNVKYRDAKYGMPFSIDYSAELPFEVEYNCQMENGGTKGLGSVTYAYDVTTQKVREITKNS